MLLLIQRKDPLPPKIQQILFHPLPPRHIALHIVQLQRRDAILPIGEAAFPRLAHVREDFDYVRAGRAVQVDGGAFAEEFLFQAAVD